MASKSETIDYLIGQIAGAGIVNARKMFGEFGVYCDEKMIALVCDDQLFIKPTAGGKAYLQEYEEGLPYPGAKPWILIPEDQWDDAIWLSELVRITAAELPPPKPKKPKKSK
ncbi:MAG: TfoX/Sxy family protein [Candidatus Cloacimonetes bacterium]|nr:TfoX/Sxy family protein [Candidatus Cloacimonadota bacterium]